KPLTLGFVVKPLRGTSVTSVNVLGRIWNYGISNDEVRTVPHLACSHFDIRNSLFDIRYSAV
ncbi:MAG: hypothetical protein ACE5KM_23700, partial [Planctomycetaceae bacterium]